MDGWTDIWPTVFHFIHRDVFIILWCHSLFFDLSGLDRDMPEKMCSALQFKYTETAFNQMWMHMRHIYEEIHKYRQTSDNVYLVVSTHYGHV